MFWLRNKKNNFQIHNYVEAWNWYCYENNFLPHFLFFIFGHPLMKYFFLYDMLLDVGLRFYSGPSPSLGMP